MSRLMMDAIDRVLTQSINTNDLNEVQIGIARLDDDKKVDLLDKLIEATMNYGDHFRGPGRSSPIVPQTPSSDEGQAFVISDTGSSNMATEEAEKEEQHIFLTK